MMALLSFPTSKSRSNLGRLWTAFSSRWEMLAGAAALLALLGKMHPLTDVLGPAPDVVFGLFAITFAALFIFPSDGSP